MVQCLSDSPCAVGIGPQQVCCCCRCRPSPRRTAAGRASSCSRRARTARWSRRTGRCAHCAAVPAAPVGMTLHDSALWSILRPQSKAGLSWTAVVLSQLDGVPCRFCCSPSLRSQWRSLWTQTAQATHSSAVSIQLAVLLAFVPPIRPTRAVTVTGLCARRRLPQPDSGGQGPARGREGRSLCSKRGHPAVWSHLPRQA